MQAPGGQEEDTSGNFAYGGWTFPYFDAFAGEEMGKQMEQPFDLLLGRKTFEIFASYWPNQTGEEGAGINNATKYVVSNTLTSHTWQKSIFIHGNIAEEIQRIKDQEGPDLQVHGSGNLIQTLMKYDLIDEYWLKIFPITLGAGKRLFAEGTMPSSYTLIESKVSPKGVIFANYKKAGKIETGTF